MFKAIAALFVLFGSAQAKNKSLVSIRDCMSKVQYQCFLVGADCSSDQIRINQAKTCAQDNLDVLSVIERKKAPKSCIDEKHICQGNKNGAFTYSCVWNDAQVAYNSIRVGVEDTSKINKQGECYKYFERTMDKYMEDHFIYRGEYVLSSKQLGTGVAGPDSSGVSGLAGTQSGSASQGMQ